MLGILEISTHLPHGSPMSAPQHELDEFYAYSRDKLATNREVTLEDLFLDWDTASQQDEINAAIREGICDIDAGRTRPAAEVIADLEQRFGASDS